MAENTRELKGKVAIVTGAGSGIGRAEAHALAGLGARVVVNDLPRGEPFAADRVVEEIRDAGGEAVAASYSVSRWDNAEAIVQTALDTWGRLDILVNNAGFGRIAPVFEMTEAEWDAVIAVNLKGTFAMVRHAAPIFVEQRSGVIVNTSSESGTGDFYLPSYAAAKEGIAGLTRAVARDVGRYGVRCNAIRPRAYDTGQATAESARKQREFLERFGRPMSGTHPSGPLVGTSAEVGAIVAWLCTDDAADANGRIFLAGGGEIGLYDEPRPARSYFSEAGWTVEALHGIRSHLLSGVRNEFVDMPGEALAIIDERAVAHVERQRARREEPSAAPSPATR